MKIPKGWPTNEMVEAAWRQLYTVPLNERGEPWENLIRALKLALAAAPTPPAESRESLIYDLTAPVQTPPAQEDEPVGVVKWWNVGGSGEFYEVQWALPVPQDGTKLYTRHDQSELRQAAEEALTVFEHAVRKDFQPRHIDRCEVALIKLRAALGRKS